MEWFILHIDWALSSYCDVNLYGLGKHLITTDGLLSKDGKQNCGLK